MPVFTGTPGNDTITGGPGPDTLIGLTGDDSYFVDDPGDQVVEAAGEGWDIVYVSGNPTGIATYVLTAGSHVEVLGTINNFGTALINLTGNELDNYITGNAVTNWLTGGGGQDILWGRGGNDFYFVDTNDIVVEYAGDGDADMCVVAVSYQLPSNVEILVTDDSTGTAALGLYGNELDNSILGNAGANTLDGGAGADILDGFGGPDRLLGRTGDDSFYVDDINDQTVEALGEGNDIVYARISYALSAGASIETLRPAEAIATTALTLIGNELANTIYGNDGANLLDGGGGGDTLIGARGNDSYYVEGGDIIVETGNQGNDIAYARGDFTLNAGADVETLGTIDNFATTAINLTGNDGANYITGNAGANVIDGGGSNAIDTLWGRGGDDTYYVEGGDIIIEYAGDGTDIVYARGGGYHLNAGAHVEVVAAANSASTTASLLSGNEFANTVIGSAGANTINGRGGADTLQGLGGADTFAFTTELGSGNVDQIVDFVSGADKIALENAIFTGLAAGALPAGAFVTGTAAQDANDRIIYDNTTGQIYFDADGNGSGAAILFATLGAGTALASTDFTVI